MVADDIQDTGMYGLDGWKIRGWKGCLIPMITPVILCFVVFYGGLIDCV